MNIKDIADSGRCLKDITIIDAHSHLGPNKYFYIPGDSSINGMIRIMDRVGISKVIVSPHLAIIADHILGNNLVLEAAKSYPERVIALATANIHYDLPNLEELKRCFQHSEFKGIKLHPDFMAYSVKKHILDPIFKFADDHGAFILTHTDSRTNSGHLLKYSEPAWFEEYLTKFAKVNLILAHCGLTSGGFKESVQLARNFKNAYLDTSGWRFSNTWSIEETVNLGISHKLLFGGDFVWNDVASTLGRILYSDIPEEDKKKILGENILEILKIN